MKLQEFSRDLKKNSGLVLLVLPSLLFIFIFKYIPLYGLILPFKNYKYDLGFFKSPWAGFSNFEFLFNSDKLLTITRNTILYNLAFIVLNTIISIVFALMLFELGRRSVRVYQTVLFFPYFISWVVAAYIFLSLFDMDTGVLNKLLQSFGYEPVMWYNEPRYWPFILMVVSVWKGAGYNAVIYYAGLMGIDPEYYEAATLDGATRLQNIRYISLPMVQHLVIILIILSIGRIMYSDFGLFYNVTLDSPLLYSTTDVIDTFVYRSLKDLGDIGMSSAVGLYQSVIGFILVLATDSVVRKINSENSIF